MPALERVVRERQREAPPGSYTRRLFDEPGLLDRKLVEEARELATAADAEAGTWEAADVLYFALVKMATLGVSLEQVEHELRRRSRQLLRRGGDAKPDDGAPGGDGSTAAPVADKETP
ncbi:MAG: phosphoribosyl-ATP diphosphatase [Myxococcales bacterium]|nr:MAG: phosphoribosyl-ATP diphosphatase [Myxococcales bacterium]